MRQRDYVRARGLVAPGERTFPVDHQFSRFFEHPLGQRGQKLRLDKE